jgi:hypothetical protein
MQLLSPTEELILAVFHEKVSDRVGAQPGQRLPAEELMKVEQRFPEQDVTSALAALVDRRLLEPVDEGRAFAITQAGVDALYTSESTKAAVLHVGAWEPIE